MTAKPIIRYVGSKQWFILNHFSLLPNNIENYFEPFLGSASLYIHMKSKGIIKQKAVLSDINSHLIKLYEEVKKSPDSIINKIKVLSQSKEEYYRIREEFNSYPKKNGAINFLYLNRLSYGGIYRVNRRGEFNVPYGNRTYRSFIDENSVKYLSKILNVRTDIKISDFKEIDYCLKYNDFICLDPPYIDNSSKFNRYDSKSFSPFDQKFLTSIIKEAHENNAKFLLFVGDNEKFANSLDCFGEILKLTRKNSLSNLNKSKVREEFIVKNY